MKNKKRFIDSHIHLYSWYNEKGIDLFEGLDNFQKGCVANAINICSLSQGEYGDVSNNIMCALYKLHNPTAFAYGGLVYPSYPVRLPLPTDLNFATQYQELMEIGFDGIKLLETKPTTLQKLGVAINNECYDEFFKQAEKDGTHFIWHVADPEFFWAKEKNYDNDCYYGNGGYSSFDEIFSWVYEVLERYPKLNVTFAHFFFLVDKPSKLEELFEKYENLSIDITPGTEMYEVFNANHSFYREFFEKYADRIIFGTDCGFPAIDYNALLTESVYNVITTDELVDNIWQVKAKGLRLSDEASDKILYTNFAEKHEKPKEINKKALKEYIRKYFHLIQNETERNEIEKAMKNL